MNKVLIAAGVLAAALPATGATAATIVTRTVAIENASFENPPLGDGRFCAGCTPGWSSGGGSAGAGAQNPTSSIVTSVPDGQNIGYLNNFFNMGEPVAGSLTQQLVERIVAGTNYQLTVDVVRRTDGFVFGEWYAELLSGNSVLALGTMSETEITPGGFKALSVNYTGTAAFADQLLGIRFRQVFDPAGGQTKQVNFDNVRLTATPSAVAAVPEPATWAMMLVGFGAVGGTMRRRNARRTRVTFA